MKEGRKDTRKPSAYLLLGYKIQKIQSAVQSVLDFKATYA